jgi:hypothetical protein
MIQIVRNQLAVAVLDVGDGTEAIVLQFENAITLIKRFGNALETHRFYAGEHISF